ncbi:MAG TPA: hypothetical protein VEW68_11670, partial [Patescibacteria group bacterium]|nr:hypothetical protein [Patescibacteria group bacterium]
MRKATGLLFAIPLLLIAGAPAVVAAPSTPSPSPVASPSPSQIPTNAFLTFDVAAGPLGTTITVTGSQFLAGEHMTLYWDPPSNKVGATVTSDANGAFTTTVKPYPGDSQGLHKLCASVAPVPC